MNRGSPECVEFLAGEYVMGTLRGPARRRFEALLRRDPALQRRVAAWEGRLARLADICPAREPSTAAWAGIERRLGLGRSRPNLAERPRPWDKLAFWRSLALAASLVMGVLAAFVTLRVGQGPDWGEAVIAHLIEYPQEVEVQQRISRETLNSALAHVNLRLAGDVGEVTFLGYCVVGRRMGVHFVADTPYGQASVIVLPGAEVRDAERRSASGYSAAVMPIHGGLLGLVTKRAEALPQVETLVMERLTRL